MKIIKILAPHIIVGISICLSLSLADAKLPSILIGALGIVMLVIAAAVDFRLAFHGITEFRKGPQKNEPEIELYMKNLISGSGSVAIFTNNMNWASDEIMGILYGKAKNDNLTIFMRKSNDRAKRLICEGANIYYYGDVMDSPIKTRFTLINLDSQSVELAVGRSASHIHRITRHHDKEDPALLLAEDMLTVFRKTLVRATVNDEGIRNDF